MDWLILSALTAIVLAGCVWCSLIDKAENIDTDESCEFWMTDED